MAQETRLKLGKFWYDRLSANLKVPKHVDMNHPHIQEYLASLPKEEETKSKKTK